MFLDIVLLYLTLPCYYGTIAFHYYTASMD